MGLLLGIGREGSLWSLWVWKTTMGQPRFVNEHFKLPLAAQKLDSHTALMVTLVARRACAKLSAPWTYDLEMKIAFFWW